MPKLPPALEAQLRTLQARLKGLSPEQRIAASELIAKIKWTQENEAIRFFVPHGGQSEFLKTIDGGFIVVSGAGNGWGKSELLAAIFAAAMWPSIAPSGFPAVFKDWKHPKRARIYSMPAELEAIGSLQTAIARLFPKGRYTSSKGRYSYPSVFVSDSGWVLDLFSYERDAKEAAGPNIGLQGFNEPPPEPLFKEAVARSRAGGYIIGGFTSLLDNVWVVDGILNKHDGKDIRVRYGSSCENCKQHGVGGNLDHDQIEKVLSQYDPDEREARFSGKPLTLSGRIYKSFDRKVHVANTPLILPKTGVTLYQAIDPAVSKPIASIWAWVGVDGVVHIYDEDPETQFEGAKDSHLGVSDYVALWKARESRSVETRIIDRHFGASRRSLGGITLKQEFAEAGLDFIDSYNTDQEVETGIFKVKEFLKYDTSKPLDGLNRPRLVISPTCKNTIAAFERWGRNPETGKPKEEYKDFSDCVRYLLMTDPIHEVARNWLRDSNPYFGVGNI